MEPWLRDDGTSKDGDGATKRVIKLYSQFIHLFFPPHTLTTAEKNHKVAPLWLQLHLLRRIQQLLLSGDLWCHIKHLNLVRKSCEHAPELLWSIGVSCMCSTLRLSFNLVRNRKFNNYTNKRLLILSVYWQYSNIQLQNEWTEIKCLVFFLKSLLCV